jgi:flagellar motor switch protein FliN
MMKEEKGLAQTITLLEREDRGVGDANGKTVFGENMELIRELKIRLDVVVGECEMSVGELFDLRDQSVVKLDREVRAPVDVLLEGRRIARGTLVAVGNNFGVRITELGSGSCE